MLRTRVEYRVGWRETAFVHQYTAGRSIKIIHQDQRMKYPYGVLQSGADDNEKQMKMYE
jgi:hypothetical protein